MNPRTTPSGKNIRAAEEEEEPGFHCGPGREHAQPIDTASELLDQRLLTLQDMLFPF